MLWGTYTDEAHTYDLVENKVLQAKLKDMEMENKLLKKLRELKGGGH